MAAPALALDHLALPAKDAQATLDFYAGVLGLPLVGAMEGDDWGGHPWLMMMFGLEDGRQIALAVLDGADWLDDIAFTDDLPHFAFAVADEEALAAWRTRLHEAGVAFREEDHGGQQSLYFADPSGLGWEITAPPTPQALGRSAGGEAERRVRAWIAGRG